MSRSSAKIISPRKRLSTLHNSATWGKCIAFNRFSTTISFTDALPACLGYAAIAYDSLLSMVMDEDQLDRHMASRRGALNKTSVRKLVNHVLSQSVSQHVAMVVSGVAKIFVGEIIEKGKNL